MTTITTDRLEDVADVLGDLTEWAFRCHEASLAVVRSGVLGETARVARGTCRGVGGQHSWVVVGDPYDEKVTVVDPTLFAYDKAVKGVWLGKANKRPHTPHGAGSIWQYGHPDSPVGPLVELAVPVSKYAQEFLDLAAPDGLDRRAWSVLAHAPVGGWPAAEIFAAMEATPEIAPLIPIDVLGMITDLNPGGLYR